MAIGDNSSIEEASKLIMDVGYNGFSYAAFAERLRVRKPSIHHLLSLKVLLVGVVIEGPRATLKAFIEAIRRTLWRNPARRRNIENSV